MNGEQENLFDAHLLKTFKVGDLVSWTHLVGDKEYGFIQDIYSENKGINRKFIFAKVMKTDGSYEPFNLSYLTKESEQKKDIQ
tara:strand:- start:2989 stop:3237 length:249 start_codon:yes stop_codon:yes gene_type:complete